eukprot:c18388_g1_i3.p2 GENE.c18388_g1_i3~~c18388_g1_i3.p2  ORF type:complete len:184 (+),score=29.06 c18388_g1_i3:493-1044(+)
MVGGSVLVFACIFLCAISAFAMGFHLAFGTYVEDYKFLGTSYLATLRSVFGEMSFESSDFNPHLFDHPGVHTGSIMITALSIVMSLGMLNVFIALISVVYNRALNTSERDWEILVMQCQADWYRILDFWTRKFDWWFHSQAPPIIYTTHSSDSKSLREQWSDSLVQFRVWKESKKASPSTDWD